MFVVLVEDDPYIAQSILAALDYLNVSVEHVDTAKAADYFIRNSAVDLCLLDLGLPDPGRAAGMVAALVSLHRCSDAGRGVGADGRPCAGAAQWLRFLAYSADLAHFGTFADALVGYTAVFCDVLEFRKDYCRSSGRADPGGSTGSVGICQISFSGKKSAVYDLCGIDDDALSGNDAQ